VSDTKLKREAGLDSIALVENPDISAILGTQKGSRLLVAFAMETGQGLDQARKKLEKKNADFVVLNDLQQAGAGFAVDTNVVTFVDATSEQTFPKMDKLDVGDRILDEVLRRFTS